MNIETARDAGRDKLGRAWAFLKEDIATEPELVTVIRVVSITLSAPLIFIGEAMAIAAALGHAGLLPAALLTTAVGLGVPLAAFIWLRAAKRNHGRSQRVRARRMEHGTETPPEGDGPQWAVLQTGRGTVLSVSARSHMREDVTYLWTSRLRPARNGMVRMDRPALTEVNGARPDPAVRRWTETGMGEDIHAEPGRLEEEYDRVAALCGNATRATESLVAEEDLEKRKRAEREAQRDRIFQKGEEDRDT